MSDFKFEYGDDREVDRESASKAVDTEIDEFNQWYLNKYTGQQPISRYERAMLKTYLMHKLDQFLSS